MIFIPRVITGGRIRITQWPYIQRDGQTNPDNFVAHRHAMIRLSQIIGALASAYVMSGDDQYVSHAFYHAKAWFVDTATMMNPSLNFAQAIKGRATGRGIGIIDTIHLIEVAQGLLVMQESSAVDKELLRTIKDWFSKYLVWLTSHQYGKDEMNAKNNHGTCWVMQVAAFAKFADKEDLLEFCKRQIQNRVASKPNGCRRKFPRRTATNKALRLLTI